MKLTEPPSASSLPLKYSLPPEQRRVRWWIFGPLILIGLFAIFVCIIPLKIGSRDGDARIAAALVDIRSMSTALDSFNADVGRYPTTKEGLSALISEPPDATGWKGPYLDRLGVNDPWGRAYVYRSPEGQNVNGFDLLSMGPDGQEGGGDDISDVMRP